MSKRRRFQRLLLGALFGMVAGFLDRRMRRKIASSERGGQ